MSMQKINLGNNNELIIRTKDDETFTDKYHRNIYHESIKEIILKNSGRLLCIGICFSDTYTGLIEFVKYTPQCILFFHGNSITKSYHVERVFDISTMQSLVLTKEEILQKYNIELPEKIKESIVQKKYLKQKVC